MYQGTKKISAGPMKLLQIILANHTAIKIEIKNVTKKALPLKN